MRRLFFIVSALVSVRSFAPPLIEPPVLAAKTCFRGHYRTANPVPTNNLAEPDFPLDKKQKYFDSHPLRETEKALLALMGTALFPTKEGFDPAKAGETLDKWLQDVDAFLAAHENDPAIQEIVKQYLVDYGNRPLENDYLPGDSRWDTPRKFTKWTDFYDSPRYHDMQGNLLRSGGNPITEAPEKITGKDFDEAPKMYVQVLGNLRVHEGFADMVRENQMTAARALPQIAYIRREALQVKMIKLGEKMWQAERGARP